MLVLIDDQQDLLGTSACGLSATGSGSPGACYATPDGTHYYTAPDGSGNYCYTQS